MISKITKFISEGPEVCSGCGEKIEEGIKYFDSGRFSFCTRCLSSVLYSIKLRPEWNEEHGGAVNSYKKGD